MDTNKLHKALAMVGFGGLAAGAAVLGAQARPDRWYQRLRKPWFQPPPWVFPPVWAAFYALIGASGYRVWRAPPSPDRTRALAFWGAQLGLNAAWPWLFFGNHNPSAALADIGLLRASIDVYTEAAQKIDPAAHWMMAPYRAWVSFATLLNTEIVRRNA